MFASLRIYQCLASKAYIFDPNRGCFKDLSTVNTLRTGDADLRFYITTVQDG